MSRTLAFLGGVAVVVVILLYTMFFTVEQTETALVLQFGKPVRVIDHPGLQFKLPYQNVVIYEKRILDFEPPAEEVIASDQKRLIVDTYVRFKIINPLQFYQSVGTENAADQRLSDNQAQGRRDVDPRLDPARIAGAGDDRGRYSDRGDRPDIQSHRAQCSQSRRMLGCQLQPGIAAGRVEHPGAGADQ